MRTAEGVAAADKRDGLLVGPAQNVNVSKRKFEYVNSALRRFALLLLLLLLYYYYYEDLRHA
jgi:hypothetical protein